MNCIVVGGSNGLGLALTTLLSEDTNNNVIVYDLKELELKKDNIQYKKLNLLTDDLKIMDEDINKCDILIYTAGIGRLDYFDNYSFNEIDANININLTSFIKVISMASNKLLNDNIKIMCISSIAGLVSSPLFSVYSASKAGVCKYIEAVNTELKKRKTPNVITNVVATSFKGSSFNGEKTTLELLLPLAEELLVALNNKEEMHKVNPELIDSIIKRYTIDPKKFSLDSFDYKLNSGRIKKGE